METGQFERISFDFDRLHEESRVLKGGMGAVAWAIMEMFKQAGMPREQRDALFSQMTQYFALPSDEDCNTVLRVLETRLREDKDATGIWYQA